MFWIIENEVKNESQVTVQTFSGIKEFVCPKCDLPLLKRPFDASMKTSIKYHTVRYDYHCAVCNQAFDRFSIETN